MNKGFYTKLAWTGIAKNKQLYYPYLIAGVAMVMVFYVFNFLGASEIVHSLPGKEVLPLLFDYGSWAIGLFSIPFLFYTNSSLIKKRKKELGLYNILGMNKKNIFTVLFWETVISYGIVIIGGIFIGVVFSKVAELGLVNIMDREVNYSIYIEWKSILYAVLVYAVIYFLILLNTLRQIHNNDPIELLHSDSVGECPPKSRWFPAAISLLFVLVAYYIVATLGNPLKYSQVFIAVGLITIGTFLLFICASVFLCKILQNSKRYYYKTSHFVTVSTMSFRMKRNGASLAAICVLVTLILATLAFSVSFYVGSTDTIKKHYPYDMGVSVEIPIGSMDEEMAAGTYTEKLRSEIENIVKNEKEAESVEAYSANMLALITDGRLDLSSDMRDTWFTPGYYDVWEKDNEKIVYIHVIFLDEYNQLCGTSEKLNDNEVLIASETINYQSDDILLYNGEEVKVNKVVNEIPKMTEVRLEGASMDSHGCEQMFLVVPNMFSFMGGADGSAIYFESNYLTYHWEYDLNMEGTDTKLQEIYGKIEDNVQRMSDAADDSEITCYLRTEKGEKFYALAGGLLFLAIIINILFVFVTALIMYYKQISEGYEDQKRFSIMRKIGMTKKEIKRSINSQMLTVFSLPLIVAGIHFAFTSNIIYILLRYAVIDDKALLIKVMWISYFFFAIVYSLVYLLTSKTYFRIVNRTANE